MKHLQVNIVLSLVINAVFGEVAFTGLGSFTDNVGGYSDTSLHYGLGKYYNFDLIKPGIILPQDIPAQNKPIFTPSQPNLHEISFGFNPTPSSFIGASKDYITNGRFGAIQGHSLASGDTRQGFFHNGQIGSYTGAHQPEHFGQIVTPQVPIVSNIQNPVFNFDSTPLQYNVKVNQEVRTQATPYHTGDFNSYTTLPVAHGNFQATNNGHLPNPGFTSPTHVAAPPHNFNIPVTQSSEASFGSNVGHSGPSHNRVTATPHTPSYQSTPESFHRHSNSHNRPASHKLHSENHSQNSRHATPHHSANHKNGFNGVHNGNAWTSGNQRKGHGKATSYQSFILHSYHPVPLHKKQVKDDHKH